MKSAYEVFVYPEVFVDIHSIDGPFAVSRDKVFVSKK
jgi:hypothetical protein